MKQFILIALFASLMIVSPVAGAATLKSYRVDAFINADETVHSVVTLEFDQPVSQLEYRLNFRITNFIARSNYDLTDCRAQNAGETSTIKCDFIGIPSSNLIRLDFDSSGQIRKAEDEDRLQLSIDYSISIPVDRRIVAIRLPEGATLAEQDANASYFPPDGELFTDGRRIGILWKPENSTIPANFLVIYSQPPQPFNAQLFIILAAVIIIAIALAIGFLYLRKHAAIGKAEAFKAVLNQDEKRIVDILMKSQGKVYQKVLVRETDFSKAKVSRLVKGMKERGIVEIEPVSGRENRVILAIGRKSEGDEKEKDKQGAGQA